MSVFVFPVLISLSALVVLEVWGVSMCVCVFYVTLSPPDTFCYVVTSTWNKLLEIKLFLKT